MDVGSSQSIVAPLIETTSKGQGWSPIPGLFGSIAWRVRRLDSLLVGGSLAWVEGRPTPFAWPIRRSVRQAARLDQLPNALPQYVMAPWPLAGGGRSCQGSLQAIDLLERHYLYGIPADMVNASRSSATLV
jgi:hypothetical protein